MSGCQCLWAKHTPILFLCLVSRNKRPSRTAWAAHGNRESGFQAVPGPGQPRGVCTWVCDLMKEVFLCDLRASMEEVCLEQFYQGVWIESCLFQKWTPSTVRCLDSVLGVVLLLGTLLSCEMPTLAPVCDPAAIGRTERPLNF